MKRTMAIVLTLATSLASGAEAAQLAVGRDAQKDVMVTIYNGNLGLVKDVRETRLPTGLHETEFTDVAAQIDPTTVHLKSLTDPAGLRILEQKYEYDLLSSQKLMEKYVGRMVRLYNTDGTYLEAKLLSTAGPVFEINGQIHLGHNGRLVLPSLPEHLVSKPARDGDRDQGRVDGRGRARLQVRGLLRVPPLHARRPDHHQGQPDQTAHAHGGRRRAGRQAAHLLRRAGLLPDVLRRAHVESEDRRLFRHQELEGQPARGAAAQGQGARVQGRRVRQPAVRR